jgi:hypothetical protein
MNVRAFLFDSAYQLITWVCIALSIGSIFYFLGKGYWRGALWAFVILLVSIVVMLGLLADRYIVEGYTRRAPVTETQERPYVVFRATRLKPLTAGNYPVIEYELENISKVEVSVLLTDATCQFTQDLKQTSFEYLAGNEPEFTMVPTKRIYGQMRFPKQILTEDQIRALNQEPEQGRLVFYARGEYKDISGGGSTYFLNFCQMYNPYIDGNLIFCDPGITFKKPNESDK